MTILVEFQVDVAACLQALAVLALCFRVKK